MADETAVPEAPPQDSRREAMAYVIGVAGWIVPGLGHALLKMWGRAAMCFLTVGMLVILGAGTFYLLAKSVETNGADVSHAGGDYGTRFLATAGVLNLLAALHAYEAARG